ncbi:MAG: methyltransferase type 11 [Cenarchaeum symbiont of Oopsacas minuta]|nr:methyltransferase type 11 [Cenarchaeum symbiont of Oopsacas minuta]
MMDSLQRDTRVDDFFDIWALNGRHQSMENEHSKTAIRFLNTVNFLDSFSFLDVGCGNGWTVRAMANNPKCAIAVGIDKSPQMIKLARSTSTSKKETYMHTDIESYKGDLFDYVFSMESMYYAKSVADAVKAVWHILKPGGMFLCGTDYYAENHDTIRWQDSMKIHLHLLSRYQWKKIFKDAGFKVKTRRICSPNDDLMWRRTMGTLFISGTKM